MAVEHLTAKDRAKSQTTAWQTVGKKLNQIKRNNARSMKKNGGAVNSVESDRTRKQHDGGGKANKKGGDGTSTGTSKRTSNKGTTDINENKGRDGHTGENSTVQQSEKKRNRRKGKGNMERKKGKNRTKYGIQKI